MTLEDKKDLQESERLRQVRELRKTRVPVGVPTLNLDYPTRDGYCRRVVCDRHGRLDKFIKAGWRFVGEDELESKPGSALKINTRETIDGSVGQVVGTHKDNTQMMGYLMEIPEELYDEDQAAKMEQLDALEAGLRAGRGLAGDEAEGLGPVKKMPIKIQQKGRRGGRNR